MKRLGWRSMAALAAVLILSVSAFAAQGGTTEGQPAAERAAKSAKEREAESAEERAESAEERAAERAESAAERAESTAESTAGLPEGLAAAGEALEDLHGAAEDLDKEELVETIEKIRSLLNSEDVKSLMSYDEVRDLAVFIFRRAERFLFEDRELSTKILETIGLKRKYVELFYAMAAVREREAFPGLGQAPSEEEQDKMLGNLLDEANRILQDPDLIKEIDDMLAQLEGIING